MTASIHKLSAGSGYDYLTRSVSCDDATGRGGQGLASYYSEKGDIPGRFVGEGLAGIDGISTDDRVTADHMKALFGVGMHPLAIERNRAFDAAPLGQGPTVKDRIAATHLGRPYPVYETQQTEFSIQVARRFHTHNRASGLPQDAPISASLRAEIRSEVAAELFKREHGREPADARELSAAIAKHSRPRSNAVAGYDLTFSPVKSVSTLWAVADSTLAAKIELAHNAAVADALGWLEAHALFTREGPGGARQVDVTGLVATAFTHRDSRAGDPDLHTHVAVANKVQTHAGRWLSIDGRVLYKAMVSISETYNTALEKHLTESLGVRFAERPNPDAKKRPIREIVGVDPALNQRFSKRRVLIERRRDQLAAKFQADHGRPPTPTEAIELAQQATLETRDAKHEPRTIVEQRATWTREAIDVLGGSEAIARMVQQTLTPSAGAAVDSDERWLSEAAAAITNTLQSSRAVWQYWHVYAEAQRQVRATVLTTDDLESVVDQLTRTVLDQHSVGLGRPADPVREPEELRRLDGTSVYRVAGSELFTTDAILEAERRLVDVAGRSDGRTLTPEQVAVGLLEVTANGTPLNAGQAEMVREMATSGARVQLGIAPAGAGKTTAMRALATAWRQNGGDVFGLAPSAVAADELHRQLRRSSGPPMGRQADTLAKLVHGIHTKRLPNWAASIRSRTLLIIDEAGMADTVSLDTVVNFALDRGASVRLIGDDQQLAAIGAGGVLRDIQSTHGAVRLSELMRFANPAEGAASLALRQGQPHALGFYLDNDRVHVGDRGAMTKAIFDAWQHDREAGRTSLMLAPTRDLVAELNQLARAHRLASNPPHTDEPSVSLSDGNRASIGDIVITRLNDRKLMTTTSDWVKNGDRWEILEASNGGVTVQHQTTRSTVHLPADYVSENVDLGYACTVHTAQGVTADTTHGIVTGDETRQQLYTLATRGRLENHLYLTVTTDGDPHNLIDPDLLHPSTATEILESVLARDGSSRSATTHQRQAFEPAGQLFEAAQAYTDTVHFAAEQALGPERLRRIDDTLDELHPGISTAPAWPALRAHLILLCANGINPLDAAEIVSHQGNLGSAVDVAAVLDSRLDRFEEPPNRDRYPLPWLPAIPTALVRDPKWGTYLRDRADQVAQLANRVRKEAVRFDAAPPAWATGKGADPKIIGAIAVWRAATGVSDGDLRPTGPIATHGDSAEWQHMLNGAVAHTRDPGTQQWRVVLEDRFPEIRNDPFRTDIAERLAAMARVDVNPYVALDSAADRGPLPDDHPAAALWWRLQGQLTPEQASRVERNEQHRPHRGEQEPEQHWAAEVAAIDPRIPSSPRWPLLAKLIQDIHQSGYDVPKLLSTVSFTSDLGDYPVGELLNWIVREVEPSALASRGTPPRVDRIRSHGPEPVGDHSFERGPSGPSR